MLMLCVSHNALGDGSRVRRAMKTVLLAAAFAFAASAASAEPYVLVYSEGSVVILPGGATVSKGEQIDAEKLVQLGPADSAIFVAQSGNVVRLDGPYCGTLVNSLERTNDKGLFGMFGGKAAAPKSRGCPK
jgi:hypothetical protein